MKRRPDETDAEYIERLAQRDATDNDARITTVADLVAALQSLPRDARVIMSDTHEFESTIATVQIDDDDVVIYAGDPARSYALGGDR